MQQNSNNISGVEFLYPKSGFELNSFRNLAPLNPFSDLAIEFLSGLSSELMKDPQTRSMPDVATFSFFCRRANLQRLSQIHSPKGIRVGRGVVFHIAPSNVPVNFAYSLLCGVLSGNANLVRVPSKEFAQVGVIVKAIEKVLEKAELVEMAKRLVLIKYDRTCEATTVFSSICDVRVIWGGDNTIAQIRQSAIPAKGFDVTFADRYSICAIKAQSYLDNAVAETVAEDFYNDTYLFDQNACSAPHLVLWVGQGSVVEKAKEKFWNALYDYTKSKYELSEVLAIDKLTSFYSQSVEMTIAKETTPDNLIWRVKTDDIPADIEDFRCKAGYFTESTSNSLDCLANIINRKYQTLAYWGFNESELVDFVHNIRPLGLDRIVPIGKTTEFNLVWDGYDMMTILSREITIL